MRELRNPDSGCPWDVRQNFETIAPYTIEEAYEVADAIRLGDMDLLLEERAISCFRSYSIRRWLRKLGQFNFDAVAKGIANKMRDRHPPCLRRRERELDCVLEQELGRT